MLIYMNALNTVKLTSINCVHRIAWRVTWRNTNVTETNNNILFTRLSVSLEMYWYTYGFRYAFILNLVATSTPVVNAIGIWTTCIISLRRCSIFGNAILRMTSDSMKFSNLIENALIVFRFALIKPYGYLDIEKVFPFPSVSGKFRVQYTCIY